MKSKIQIKRINGSIIFEYETEDYSVKKALEVYIKEERAKGKENVDLSNINLSGADLSGVDLSGADLSGANLSRAYLSETNLENVSLVCADLSFTDLYNANLNGADLKDTKLSGANLSNAILNSAENIKYAYCCSRGHGEIGRQLLAIKINDEIRLFCGCFSGNEIELRAFIERGQEKYKESRLIALDTVLKLINVEKS